MKIKLNNYVLSELCDAIGIPEKGKELEEGEFAYTIVEEYRKSRFLLQVYTFLKEKNVKKQFFYTESLEDSYDSIPCAIEEIKSMKKRLETHLTEDLTNARLKHPAP
jgi:hypothetical protein